jgi:pimeloyl-ACP methyl ester carboxylesterase
VCGDVTAVDSWSLAATRHGTLIELLGDTRCNGSSRYRWTSSTEVLEGRIEAALAAVRSARSGLLDTDRVVLMGYSQGAIRAEALAKHYPERFPWVLLGGVPVTPAAESFRGVVAVALVGGQREGLAHLRAGEEALRSAGRPVQSFILPGAGHGEFGPDADRVMGDAFGWLLRR